MMDVNRRANELSRWRYPDSLLCVSDCFCVSLLSLSILLFICLPLVTDSLHVPAHAFVQSGVDPGQVRRWLTVAERGQPQLAELSLADAEVRHAGNADRRDTDTD